MRTLSSIPTALECPDFASYLLQRGDPISIDKLNISVHGPSGRFSTLIPRNTDLTFLLRYKDKDAQVLNITEDTANDAWAVMQVKGAGGRPSFRVNCCLAWQKLLAHQTLRLATSDRSTARYITMPPIYAIENIDGARSESAYTHYGIVAHTIGMRWSDLERMYIKDL